MSHWILVVLLILGSVPSDNVYGPEPLPKRPLGASRIVVAETTHDWGDAYQGDVVVHRFTVKNAGTGPLTFPRVRPSAGNVTVTHSDEIAPGLDGYVQLTVDVSRPKPGDTAPAYFVEVWSNDPITSKVRLHITGGIRQVVRWEPKRPVFDTLAGEPITGSFEIKRVLDAPMDLTKIETIDQNISIEDMVELGPGHWRIDVSAEAETTPINMRDTLVARLRFAGDRDLTVNIPVLLVHRPHLQTSPARGIRFRRKETARFRQGDITPLTRSIRVSSLDPNVEFAVTRLEILDLPEDLVKATVQEVEPGREFDVTVSVLRDSDDRNVRGKLVIHTDDAIHPTIELGVYLQFPRKKQVRQE